MSEETPEKWYFQTYVLVIAILCVGPLALPLLWWNPRYSLLLKVIVTVAVIVGTYYLTILFCYSLGSLEGSLSQLRDIIKDGNPGVSGWLDDIILFLKRLRELVGPLVSR